VARKAKPVNNEEPLKFSTLKAFPLESFPFPPSTIKTLTGLVGSPEGCHILFYGDKPETGKTSFAVSLASAVGKSTLFVERKESIGTELTQSEMEALQIRLNAREHVLVVDSDTELFCSSTGIGDFLPRGWIHSYLKASRLTSIWVTDDINSVPPGLIQQFDYVLEFNQKFESSFSWQESVPAEWHAELKQYSGLQRADIERCLAVWERTSDPTENSDARKVRLVDLLERRKKAGCNSLPKHERMKRGGVATLSSDLWNADVPLQDIVDGVGGYLRWKAENPAMAEPYCVLASGVPGSGKSLFLKYLAQVHNLGVKAFHSSDIVRSLVGETEQHIAGIFKDVGDDEVVLLEECDSLLYSRSRSQYRFEVSAINEFLAQLEAFPGLVFCSTNFLRSLDEAVARRFVAKVVFSSLRLDQLPLAWATYFPDLDFPATEAMKLLGLCAGDFKNVANKRRWSSGTAGTAEILTDLVRELETKERFGKTTRKVGFR